MAQCLLVLQGKPPSPSTMDLAPATAAREAVEKADEPGIQCRMEDRNMSSPSTTPNPYPYQNEPTWSKSEKASARTAFEAALKREFQQVIQETKHKANHIKEPAELWDLEHYLSERRKEIDRKYDYRYSQLTHVFGRLLYEGRVSEEELRGLGEDKLKRIRSLAGLIRECAD
jgi:hypothetical protein